MIESPPPDSDTIAFLRLSPDDMNALRPLATTIALDDGQIAFRAGDANIDLFVVESGQLRIINPADADSLIVTHGPGHFAGDIDLLTGRPVIVTAIADGPTTVLRIDSSKIRETLNRLPSLSKKMLIAIQERRRLLAQGGRLGLRLVGRANDRETALIKEFLYKNFVPFTWAEPTSDDRQTPRVSTGGGQTLQRPTLRQLAELSGVWCTPPSETVDLAIIGAGPSGMAAAVYAASEGLSVTVLDQLGPGGQAGASSKIENFMGFPSGLSGSELATRSVLQMLKFGARLIAPARVTSLEPATSADAPHTLHFDCGSSLCARSVLVATGVRWRKLSADGAERFEGAGVHYACTAVEAAVYHRCTVAVVGAGNSAGQAVMFLAESCRDRPVHMLVRGAFGPGMSDYLIARIRSTANVIVHERCEVAAVLGEHKLNAISIRNVDGDSADETVSCAAMFVFIGSEPGCDWLPHEVARDDLGFLISGTDAGNHPHWPLTDREPCALETTMPRVLVAGDLRSGSTKRVGFAVGDGSMAVTCVHRLIAIRA